MPFDEGILFFEKAVEEKQNERLYLRWIHGYQSQMSFDEFKRHLTIPREGKELTEAETYEKVREILRKDR